MKLALVWSTGLAAAFLVTDFLVIRTTATLSAYFLDFIFFAVVAALIPVGIFDYLNASWVSNIENQLPEVLRIVAQSQRTGSTLPRAFEEAARRSTGALAVELGKAVAKMSWGVPFDDALKSFSERVGTPLVRRTVSLIIECYKIGGNIEQVMEQTAGYTREIHGLQTERYTETRPYLVVIYLATGVFLVSIYMLFKSFFVPISQISTTGIGGASLSAFSPAEFKQALYLMAILQAALSGLVAGKISSGSALSGVKHSIALLALVFVVFLFI